MTFDGITEFGSNVRRVGEDKVDIEAIQAIRNDGPDGRRRTSVRMPSDYLEYRLERKPAPCVELREANPR